MIACGLNKYREVQTAQNNYLLDRFSRRCSDMREMLLQHFKLFVGIVQLITACSSLSMSEFYPYGVGNGDTELPANDDGSSGEIPISILFPYFDRNHDSLFVSTVVSLICWFK